MSKQTIGIGTTANDGTGDTLREAGAKINANFDDLYGITGQQHMIPVMASGMTSRTTSGAALTEAETAGSLIMTPALDFDPNADEFAQFMLPMPDSWDGGAIYAEFIWTSVGAGDVVWGIQGVALDDADPLTTAFEAGIEVTDGVATAGDVQISGRTAAFTLGSYAVAGALGIFQVYRNADDGADTSTSDARLLGIRLYITTIDYEDS